MRVIDGDRLKKILMQKGIEKGYLKLSTVINEIELAPIVNAISVKSGHWILEAHNERVNCRWNVTAKCSKCEYEKGEIYVAFFPGVPDVIAKDIILDNAKSVKLDNYCPDCGLKLDGGVSDVQVD